VPLQTKNSWIEGLEPPCWGSAEAPLVPRSLARACRGVVMSGFKKRDTSGKTHEVAMTLASLATFRWRESLGDVRPVDESLTLVDLVVAEVEKIYQRNPDSLDIPFLETPLDHYRYASTIPFEFRTWQFIFGAGIVGDFAISMLVLGTFRELMDRLGDARAALDIAVTATSWIRMNGHGMFGFVVPDTSETLAGAVELLSVRSFRCAGRKTTNEQYSREWADVMGKRSGIGLARHWTLEACGIYRGVTRERVRQVEMASLWDSAIRVWGRPSILEELSNALLESAEGDVVISNGESVTREAGLAILIGYGYPAEDCTGPRTVEDELELLDIKLSKIRKVAFDESERIGFITSDELRHHLVENFPVLIGEMFEEVLAEIVTIADLPYGYVYVEHDRSSYVRSWLTSLISVLGPQQFEEAYKAIERHCKVRRPGLVFPPRAVIRDFIMRDEMFWLEGDEVGLVEPISRDLIGIERWLQETIMGCTGHVIHRTELWSRGRDEGVKGGTLSVYAGYSLYFKPVQGGLVTMTGFYPSEIVGSLARSRASAIRVPTRRGDPVVSGGVVKILVEVGNDLIDGGVMGTTKELREMLGAGKLKAFANGQRCGTIGWSDKSMIGFSGVLKLLGVQAGDEVVFSFAVADGEMIAELATNE
jgi:hypothetical protein